MTKRAYTPTPEEQAAIREAFAYDPETGIVSWRHSSPWRTAGQKAGSANKGIGRYVTLSGRDYRSTRVAWFLHTGEWPHADLEVDHADRNPFNDRWYNLRLATCSENMCNTTLRKDNTSGAKGVFRIPSSGRWMAYINKDKKRYRLGYFEKFEDAVSAYAEAAARLHGPFANTSTVKRGS